MPYFKKQTVTIEAYQYNGSNMEALCQWMTSDVAKSYEVKDNHQLTIRTLEGDMIAELNDYIIKGVKGEFYPCPQKTFLAGYDKIAKDFYRKKPLMVEAMNYTGKNSHDILPWIKKHGATAKREHEATGKPEDAANDTLAIYKTAGKLSVVPGAWVIKGAADGDVYPCDPEIFAETYLLVEVVE